MGMVFSVPVSPFCGNQVILRVVKTADISTAVAIAPLVNRSLLEDLSLCRKLLNLEDLVFCLTLKTRRLDLLRFIQQFESQ